MRAFVEEQPDCHDPLTGEGIRYALWSGRIAGALAAEALAAGEPPDPIKYARRLAFSSSGAALALGVRLADRLYGAQASRWRRVAASAGAAEGMASLISGRFPGPAQLARSVRALRGPSP